MEVSTNTYVFNPSLEELRFTIEKEKHEMEKKRLISHKIQVLDELMTSLQPKDNTYSSEDKWKSTYSDKNMDIIENKIMELVKQL